MSERGLDAPPVPDHGHQVEPLERVEDLGTEPLVENAHAEGLGVGDQLQRLPFRSAQRDHAGGDDLEQPGGDRERPRQPPEALLALQQVAVPGREHQLAEEERVATARLRERSCRAPLEVPAEHRAEKLLDRRGVERAELDAVGDLVLPESDDGVGRLRLAADGGDHEGVTLARQLTHERGRHVVQPVGVVDQQGEVAVGPPLGDGGSRPAEQLGGRPLTGKSREQRGEGAQRDAGGRLRPKGPGGREAVAFRQLQAFGGQARLADTGRTGDHHAAVSRR